MKKFIYRTLLIILFIIAIFSIKSYGASDFSYTLDDNGNATITAYNGSESDLIIPSTIDGHNIISIGGHAFDDSHNSTNGQTIKNVVISEGIQKIEILAFAKCNNLESVTLPESLTFLDMQTFLQCSKLKSINIPSQIKSIANSTFQETGFKEFIIPENVKFIDSRALASCPNLEKITVYSKDIEYSTEVFAFNSENLVLYGYEGSTTQTYAQENGLQFKVISDNEEDIPITSITLNKSSLSLYVGNYETLVATILPDDASDKTLIWSTSDSNVATVENGKVTAKSIGSATITVSNVDGTIKSTCDVTVLNKDSSSEDSFNNKEQLLDSKKSISNKDADNTVTGEILPQAGFSNIILILLIFIFIVIIMLYKKCKNLKDI